MLCMDALMYAMNAVDAQMYAMYAMDALMYAHERYGRPIVSQ